MIYKNDFEAEVKRFIYLADKPKTPLEAFELTEDLEGKKEATVPQIVQQVQERLNAVFKNIDEDIRIVQEHATGDGNVVMRVGKLRTESTSRYNTLVSDIITRQKAIETRRKQIEKIDQKIDAFDSRIDNFSDKIWLLKQITVPAGVLTKLGYRVWYAPELVNKQGNKIIMRGQEWRLGHKEKKKDKVDRRVDAKKQQVNEKAREVYTEIQQMNERMKPYGYKLQEGIVPNTFTGTIEEIPGTKRNLSGLEQELGPMSTLRKKAKTLTRQYRKLDPDLTLAKAELFTTEKAQERIVGTKASEQLTGKRTEQWESKIVEDLKLIAEQIKAITPETPDAEELTKTLKATLESNRKTLSDKIVAVPNSEKPKLQKVLDTVNVLIKALESKTNKIAQASCFDTDKQWGFFVRFCHIHDVPTINDINNMEYQLPYFLADTKRDAIATAMIDKKITPEDITRINQQYEQFEKAMKQKLEAMKVIPYATIESTLAYQNLFKSPEEEWKEFIKEKTLDSFETFALLEKQIPLFVKKRKDEANKIIGNKAPSDLQQRIADRLDDLGTVLRMKLNEEKQKFTEKAEEQLEQYDPEEQWSNFCLAHDIDTDEMSFSKIHNINSRTVRSWITGLQSQMTSDLGLGQKQGKNNPKIKERIKEIQDLFNEELQNAKDAVFDRVTSSENRRTLIDDLETNEPGSDSYKNARIEIEALVKYIESLDFGETGQHVDIIKSHNFMRNISTRILGHTIQEIKTRISEKYPSQSNNIIETLSEKKPDLNLMYTNNNGLELKLGLVLTELFN